MSTATVYEAKTHLSRLIDRALAGEEVVIVRGRTPVVTLCPVSGVRQRRRLGGKPGVLLGMARDFNAELPDFADVTR